jgi:ring-1,2-phenylacetyl-CoA epoxidase subunit PaaD
VVTPAQAAAAVPDPELRVLTIADLGILRDVSIVDGLVTVTVTPTYAGCPAMEAIRADIVRALAAAGYPDSVVRTQLAPAWSTDWISDSGRAKLAAAGIAPPSRVAGSPPALARPVVLGLPGRGHSVPPDCPRCGATESEELSRFSSTACKALWRCRSCGEPFDAVKPL